MPSSSLHPTRRVAALVAAASLTALFFVSAAPAQAADAPWSPPVTMADAYGVARTAVAPDGSITTVAETAFGITAVTSTDAGATWQTPVLLSSGSDFFFRPSIAITSSGLRAAVWAEETEGVRAVYAATSANSGATWSAPVALPTVDSYVDDPIVASSSATGFTVAWNEGFNKYASSSSDGGATWGAAQALTIAMNSYGTASLVATDLGQIVAVFQEFDGDAGLYSVQSKTSTDGGLTWGPSVPVSGPWSGMLGNSVFLGGTSPSAGTVVSLWTHGASSGGDDLFAATSLDGGASWGTPVTVYSGADYLRYFRVMSIDAASVGIVWSHELGSTSVLSYSTLAVDGTASSAPVTITSTGSAFFERLPSFSTLGSTRVVSWYEARDSDADSGYRVSASCDAGATWNAPVELAIGSTVAENHAVTVVSGTTFTGMWNMDDDGPSGQSLQSSSSTPCAVAAAAGPSALAATGSDVAPLVILAFAVLGLGAGILTIRRRTAAA